MYIIYNMPKCGYTHSIQVDKHTQLWTILLLNGIRWKQGKLRTSDIPFFPTVHFRSSSWQTLRQSQARWDILPLKWVLGLLQGLLSGGCARKNFKRRQPGGFLTRWLMDMSSVSTLSSHWTSKLGTQSPHGGSFFWPLVLYPRLILWDSTMSMGELLCIDWLVK